MKTNKTTKNKTETCECGHDRFEHDINRTNTCIADNDPNSKRMIFCPCEKFKSQNQTEKSEKEVAQPFSKSDTTTKNKTEVKNQRRIKWVLVLLLMILIIIGDYYFRFIK